MRVDLTVSTPLSASTRTRQLEGMFDVPRAEKATLRWRGEVPIETRDWAIGLIVGPSGSGKTQLARHLFGDDVDPPLAWRAASVIDDFAARFLMDEVAGVCQAVGFNTIPAWLRPYAVLSRGEQFRVDLARRLLEGGDLVVVDEFSSVVDRQVAKIAAHAVQKWVRARQRRFVAVSCHEDVIDWLQPDWVLEPAGMRFAWRTLQRRPELACVVARVPIAAWDRFAPFHYLTAHLHKAARCFGLWCDGRLAAFAGVLYRTHPRVQDIVGVSRVVTLPDWQGLGLGPRLLDTLGSCYRALGWRLHMYPSHPHLIRVLDRSPNWTLVRQPESVRNVTSATSRTLSGKGAYGGRTCAVFHYVGPCVEKPVADRVLGDVYPPRKIAVAIGNKRRPPRTGIGVRKRRGRVTIHA